MISIDELWIVEGWRPDGCIRALCDTYAQAKDILDRWQNCGFMTHAWNLMQEESK